MVSGLQHDAGEIKLKILELERAVSRLSLVRRLPMLTLLCPAEQDSGTDPRSSLIVYHTRICTHLRSPSLLCQCFHVVFAIRSAGFPRSLFLWVLYGTLVCGAPTLCNVVSNLVLYDCKSNHLGLGHHECPAIRTVRGNH